MSCTSPPPQGAELTTISLQPAAFERREAHDKQMLKEALALLPNAGGQAAQHLKLFVADLESELLAFELGCHLYPVNSIGYGGVTNNFVESLDWLREEDDHSFIARLGAFPAQCDQYVALLEEGIKRGRPASRAMLRSGNPHLLLYSTSPFALVLPQLQGFRAEFETNGKIGSRVASLPEKLTEAGEQASASAVEAALKLEVFFEKVYIPHAREGCGCLSLPEPSKLYAHCLR